MKRFVIFIVFLMPAFLYAQTQVSGEQSGHWTIEQAPYIVNGDITVPADSALIIDPGVSVEFQGHYKITVLGKIIARGNETDSIIFTSVDTQTGWGGISIGTSVNGSVTSATDISLFSYCKFENGKTYSGDYPDTHGGAVRLINSNARFYHCDFVNNDATPGEGMGGAVYAINTGSSDSTLTEFYYCKFIENKAYSEGGAIKFSADLNSVVFACEFRNNTTSYGGGAIMFYNAYNTEVTKCLFANNITQYSNGGAIETLGSDNRVSFKNCTFYGNRANGGSGGAAAFYYATVSMINCIAYENYSQYDDDNVYVDGSSASATISYSDMPLPEYNSTGQNNINADPLFVDAANGDFHLSAGSPCIDAGTDVGLPYSGSAPDMGCYEYGFIANVDDQLADIKYFPNPTDGWVLLEPESFYHIRIYDLQGKQLAEMYGNAIDLTSVRSGIYIVRVSYDGKAKVFTIIKNNR